MWLFERKKKDHQWLSNPILMLKFSLSYPHVMKQTKCFCLLNHYIILPRFSVNCTDWRLLIFFFCWLMMIMLMLTNNLKNSLLLCLTLMDMLLLLHCLLFLNRLSFSPALRCTTFRLRQLWDSNFAGLYQIEGRRFHLLTASLSITITISVTWMAFFFCDFLD